MTTRTKPRRSPAAVGVPCRLHCPDGLTHDLTLPAAPRRGCRLRLDGRLYGVAEVLVDADSGRVEVYLLAVGEHLASELRHTWERWGQAESEANHV